jgi:hypothetical protein
VEADFTFIRDDDDELTPKKKYEAGRIVGIWFMFHLYFMMESYTLFLHY